MSRVTVFFEKNADMLPLPKTYQKNIALCLEAVPEKLGQRDRFEVCLTVVDNAKIQELNLDTRGIDQVTDVLSFPMLESEMIQAKKYARDDRNPKTGAVILGDIVISVERAREQALEYGHSLMREICFLSVHSMLHLFGYDHVDDAEGEAFMIEMQEKILNETGITREAVFGETYDKK